MNRYQRYAWPLAAAGVIGLAGVGAWQAVGRVYGAAEATVLLEALSRAGLYLGSAGATASATTLALMLTLIGMLRRIDKDFDRDTYIRVELVAKLATAGLMLSLVVLLGFTFPVGEFEELPKDWYTTLYRVSFAAIITLVALLAATVTVLYQTIHRVIASVTPGDEV